VVHEVDKKVSQGGQDAAAARIGKITIPNAGALHDEGPPLVLEEDEKPVLHLALHGNAVCGKQPDVVEENPTSVCTVEVDASLEAGYLGAPLRGEGDGSVRRLGGHQPGLLPNRSRALGSGRI
jgi:hypothetical protein